MEDLSERQKLILDYILSELQKKGYPPSVREIGEAVGLSSSSSVHAHLAKLEEMGYLRRDPTKPRAIEVLVGNSSPDTFNFGSVKYVPIVGQVTAGQPILAEQNIQDYFPLPADFSVAAEVFMLKVKGDSMINAGIYDGDFVIVNRNPAAQNGEIVVAMLEDEATVKRFYKESDCIRLQPENEKYEPILAPDIRVVGKVIGLFRKMN
ncbi:repressor LexA [Hydrogenispora ethanolica]|uniref:LexA repressor n=1 Tax=Hydrogenispora ethanolica TaxID=1082276 RepID=A0A4R1RBX2_HYDET|nr:repressor LexA [Hydrogenispora ethanolica]